MAGTSGKAGFVEQSQPVLTPDESLIWRRSAGMAILLQNARINI